MIKKRPIYKGGDEWRIAYIDMLTNVLIFFIMAFSLSIADVGRLRSFAEFFSGKDITKIGKVFPSKTGDVPIDKPGGLVPQSSVAPIFTELKKLSQMPGVQVSQKEEGLTLTLSDKVLYDTGKADLKKASMQVMDKMGNILKKTMFKLRVEGHTDNVPILTLKFPSNWELSTARAVSVVRYLVKEKDINPDRLSAVGYGEFKPVASNDTVKGKAANRRVELVLLGAKL